MLLHRLFSVFLCAHNDQDQEGAILELSYPDDQSKEIVGCKVFHNDDGICSCVLGRQRIISPKLSLDPRTLLDRVQIDADGWLQRADSFTYQQGSSAIPNVDHAARTSQSLSGPVSVYFVLQLEIMPPLSGQKIVLECALGSNSSLFSFDREYHLVILDMENTAGVEIVIVDNSKVCVEVRCQGKDIVTASIYRDKSDSGVWALDVGVFIDFRKKQIAFVDVEDSKFISRLTELETSQPLFSLLKICQSRVRISSGRKVHISREMKALLLLNSS